MNKRKALGGRWQSLLDRREDPRGQELEELWERPSDRTSGAIQQSISMRPIIYIK